MPGCILSLRSRQTFPPRPNMVWLMWCKWGIWNTPPIQLYLVLSCFRISCGTFNTSLLDEANTVFWPWHFTVRDTKGATIFNYVQLILASHNHEHDSKMACLDKTLFNMKGFSHFLGAAGWWTVHHTEGHNCEPITMGISSCKIGHETILLFRHFHLVLWKMI